MHKQAITTTNVQNFCIQWNVIFLLHNVFDNFQHSLMTKPVIYIYISSKAGASCEKNVYSSKNHNIVY